MPAADESSAVRRSRNPFLRLLAVAALLTAASSGCGGGSSRGGLSKAEFIDKADAICTTGRAQIKRLPKPKTYAELPAYIRRGLPIQEHDIAEIRKLKAPGGDEREVDLLLDLVDRTNEAIERLGAAVERGDAAQANLAHAEYVRANEDATRRAERYGFRVCGQPLEQDSVRSGDAAS